MCSRSFQLYFLFNHFITQSPLFLTCVFHYFFRSWVCAWVALGPCGTFVVLILQIRGRFVHSRITFCFLSSRFLLWAWALGQAHDDRLHLQQPPCVAEAPLDHIPLPWPCTLSEQMWGLFMRDWQQKWPSVTAGVGALERTPVALREQAHCSLFLSLGIAAWALDQQSRIGAFKQMSLNTVRGKGSIYVNHLCMLRAGFPFDVLSIVAGIRV